MNRSDAVDRAITWLVAPLDRLRAAFLRRAGGHGRALLGDRSLRVGVYTAAGLLMSLALTCAAPVWLFALGPLVLGVPHLVADVRYLVVRPGVHRRAGLAFSVGIPLLAVMFTSSMTIGFLSGFGAIAFARASHVRRAIALVLWTAVVLLANEYPYDASLALVHGHNLLAVMLFAFA
ncbi:MAG TPA: hypothetical protein VM580_05595, partial [Labilithrix sp.]|nr:hypothetical protein [Labilithrix sp.]